MITVPIITHLDGRRRARWCAHITIATAWTCWSCHGVRYRWTEAGELVAMDADGHQWWFNGTNGKWLSVV